MTVNNFRKYMLCRAKKSVAQRAVSLAREALLSNVELQLQQGEYYPSCMRINGVLVDNLSAGILSQKKYG